MALHCLKGLSQGPELRSEVVMTFLASPGAFQPGYAVLGYAAQDQQPILVTIDDPRQRTPRVTFRKSILNS